MKDKTVIIIFLIIWIALDYIAWLGGLFNQLSYLTDTTSVSIGFDWGKFGWYQLAIPLTMLQFWGMANAIKSGAEGTRP